MEQNDTLNKLKLLLGKDKVKSAMTLAPYSTFKMGGPAQYYFEAQSADDIVNAIRACKELKLKLTVLGGASNVIVSDSGIEGLVVRNRYIEKKEIKTNSKTIDLVVSSGYPMGRLVIETVDAGLSGFEYHLGLPGTLGGAVFMNSKWTNPPSYVGDNLISAEVVDREGTVRQVDAAYFRFKYGYSWLQATQEILLTATFRLRRKSAKALQQISQESLAYRKKTQPFGVASSGCFFKNTDGTSAGMIIDKLGLKGYRVGNLVVSDKHANFIINEGNASAVDFKKMIDHIKRQAHKNLGVELVEEVRFLS